MAYFLLILGPSPLSVADAAVKDRTSYQGAAANLGREGHPCTPDGCSEEPLRPLLR